MGGDLSTEAAWALYYESVWGDVAALAAFHRERFYWQRIAARENRKEFSLIVDKAKAETIIHGWESP